MWWSRATLTLSLALAAAGCGFTPDYAPGGPRSTLRDRVEVAAPNDRLEYEFVADLEQRLGRAVDPVYALDYDIATRRVSVGVNKNAEVTRYNVIGTVNWRLTRKADDSLVAKGNEQSFTSYSATGSSIATRSAGDDARDRLMLILADQVVAAITAALAAGAE